MTTPKKPGRKPPSFLYVRAGITIIKARRGRVEARVSDSGTWSVSWRRGVWTCTCDVAKPCNHMASVALIVDQPKGQRHLDWGQS